MPKEPKFSIHADPNMKWPDTRICHDCMNKVDDIGHCDVFDVQLQLPEKDAVARINEAISKNECDFYLRKE